jgi:hypothetical protein
LAKSPENETQKNQVALTLPLTKEDRREAGVWQTNVNCCHRRLEDVCLVNSVGFVANSNFVKSRSRKSQCQEFIFTNMSKESRKDVDVELFSHIFPT